MLITVLRIALMAATALVLTDGLLQARPVDPGDYTEISGIFVFMLILAALIDFVMRGALDHKRG